MFFKLVIGQLVTVRQHATNCRVQVLFLSHRVAHQLCEDMFDKVATVVHSHAERVRPEHQDLLDTATADNTEEAVVLRAGATVVAAGEVNPARAARADRRAAHLDRCVRPRRPAACDPAPAHRARRPGQPIVAPIRLARAPHCAGCKSGMALPVDPGWANPVHDEATLREIAEGVHESVG